MTKPKRERKRRFSTVICKTDFDGRILEVQGRLRLAAFLLLAFTLGIGYVLTLDKIPIPVRVLAGFGGLFTAYGFFDTLFGKCYLKFDTEAGELLAIRGNPFGRVHYKGPSEGRVSVRQVRAGSTSNTQRIPHFMVVLRVGLDDAVIDYQLEVQTFSEEVAKEKVVHWNQALSLQEA